WASPLGDGQAAWQRRSSRHAAPEGGLAGRALRPRAPPSDEGAATGDMRIPHRRALARIFGGNALPGRIRGVVTTNMPVARIQPACAVANLPSVASAACVRASWGWPQLSRRQWPKPRLAENIGPGATLMPCAAA